MAPCTLPGTSGDVNEARWLHTCSRSCAFEEKKTKKKNNTKPALTNTHHDTHSNPATGITSRRRATKHVPCVSPYLPASIDPGFVEIRFVQLSQLPMAKTASVSFPRPVFLHQMVQKKEKKNYPSPPPAIVTVVIAIASLAQTSDTSSVLGWGALAFMAEHAGSREVTEARRPHTRSRPCAFEEKKCRKTKKQKNLPHPEHTTKAAAARRTRPPRDDARKNTSHALAHTLPLP